ncbi:hypothetical protein SC1_03616 [Sphingopyxis sp. C-1]|nr:hypothetical protein SC1_03616 [Sphingopyxis sp. C-1]
MDWTGLARAPSVPDFRHRQLPSLLSLERHEHRIGKGH